MIAGVVWVLMLINSPQQYQGPYAFFPSRAECERARPAYNDAYKNPKPPIPPIMGTLECRVDTRTLKERACLLSQNACAAGKIREAIADYKACLKKFHDQGICETYATCRGHILNADGSRMREPNGTPAGFRCWPAR